MLFDVCLYVCQYAMFFGVRVVSMWVLLLLFDSGTGCTPKIKESDKGVRDKQNARIIIFFDLSRDWTFTPFDLISDKEFFFQKWVQSISLHENRAHKKKRSQEKRQKKYTNRIWSGSGFFPGPRATNSQMSK